MSAFLRSEVFRLVRRRMLWILVLFVVLLPVALYLLIYTSTSQQLELIRSGRAQTPGGPQQLKQLEDLIASLRPARLPEMAMGLVMPIAAILGIVLAGNTTGSEFGWGTVRTVLAHGPRRAAFLFAKLVALAGSSFAFVIAGFIATLIGSILVAVMAGGDASVPSDFLGRFFTNIAKVGYATLPYVAFATMVAVLARSAAAGIGFGIVLFFAESLIAQLAIGVNRDLQALFDAGIARNVTALTRSSVVVAGQQAPPALSDVWISGLVLALYVIAFVAIAVHRIAKRDLTLA